MTLLLTGATGFIGSALLERLLTSWDGDIELLVRKGSPRPLCGSDAGGPGPIGRGRTLRILEGDLTTSGLGISRGDRKRLERSLVRVVHCAGDVRWDRPLEDALETNARGTERVLDLARGSDRIELVTHVSTTFVCGRRTGSIEETWPRPGAAFNNSYEESKFRAEEVLRARSADVPIAVVRPPAVVGDSVTGRTSAFNVIYFPLKVLYHDLLHVIPGSPRDRVHLVPIDCAVRVLEAVALGSRRGVYQLAFRECAGSIGQLMLHAVRVFNELRPDRPPLRPVRFVPRWLYRVAAGSRSLVSRTYAEEEVEALLAQYEGYASRAVEFACDRSREVLADLDREPPRFEDFLDPMLRYCVASRWGRRPPPMRDGDARRSGPAPP